MGNKLFHTSLAVGLALFTVSGFAQDPSGAGAGAQQPSAPTTATPDPTVGAGQQMPQDTGPQRMDDKKFVKDAAQGGMMEVELGKLGTEKASNDAIKQFAQKIVDDHTKANEELKAVASKAGIEVPTETPKKLKGKMEKLGKLSGTEFDKAYIKAMVNDHEDDISLFQKEAQGGSNAEVQAFATKTLPTLQEHLTAAKGLKDAAKGKPSE